MAERTSTPVFPFPPLSDDARALALAARGMTEQFGGTFGEMAEYVAWTLRDGPIREAIGPAGADVGEEWNGRVLIFPVALIVSPSEVEAAAQTLYGFTSAEKTSDCNQTREDQMSVHPRTGT